MRRYIDADKLKEMVNKQYSYCHGYTGTKKDVYREALLAVKSAIHCQSVSDDMQKVIYCKDCKHYKSFDTYFYICNKYGGHVTKNDFCSRAESKDENDDR